MLIRRTVAFAYAGNALGASTDERKFANVLRRTLNLRYPLVKLIFSFLLSYPLAAVLKRMPDKAPWQKNLFIVGYVRLRFQIQIYTYHIQSLTILSHRPIRPMGWSENAALGFWSHLCRRHVCGFSVHAVDRICIQHGSHVCQPSPSNDYQ
jgi:hypothetical protein